MMTESFKRKVLAIIAEADAGAREMVREAGGVIVNLSPPPDVSYNYGEVFHGKGSTRERPNTQINRICSGCGNNIMTRTPGCQRCGVREHQRKWAAKRKALAS